MDDSTHERAGWIVRDMHGRPVAAGRTPDEAEAMARRIGAMPDRARFEPVTTEAEFLALQLTLPDEETGMSESESVEGWIVYGPDGRPAAAGPTLDEACDTAKAVGVGAGYSPLPATEAELDALDLPPGALGIREGGRPWWRYPEPPDGPTDRPVIAPAGEDVHGPRVHVWGPATGNPPDGLSREYLGRGHLLGYLHRERTYLPGSDVPHFTIGPEYVAATARLDVSLPIVADADPDRDGYLPEYPRFPDCGGRIVWAEAGRAGSRNSPAWSMPGLRRKRVRARMRRRDAASRGAEVCGERAISNPTGAARRTSIRGSATRSRCRAASHERRMGAIL